MIKETFEILSQFNPNVLEQRTGKTLKFNEIYGNNFEAINNERMLKNICMYLDIGGSNDYPLCEEIIRIDGKIQVVKEYSPCELGSEAPIWRNGQVVLQANEMGMPIDVYFSLPMEIYRKHCTAWDNMTTEQKKEWMDKQLWKEWLKQ